MLSHRHCESLGSRMKAATLSTETRSALQAFAWEQWSQLGVSGAGPHVREERAADPEALILFTLEIGRGDPRLFDEVLDWLALNEPLVSVHRLRNLCTNPEDRLLVDATLTWSARERRREQRPGAAPHAADDHHLEGLFRELPSPTGALDPAFSRHGLARTRLERSGHSLPPRLHDPICFALRLRRLLGVGVRAEIVRTLLTVRAPRLSGTAITASAGFSRRNVREGLAQLHEAGVIVTTGSADDRQYTLHHQDWSALLGLPSAPALPLHYDWISSLRALTRIVRWLEQPGLDTLTPYLRASQARTLIGEIDVDLRNAGITPALDPPRGSAYWDEFVAIVRAAVAAADPAVGEERSRREDSNR